MENDTKSNLIKETLELDLESRKMERRENNSGKLTTDYEAGYNSAIRAIYDIVQTFIPRGDMEIIKKGLQKYIKKIEGI